MSNTSWGYIKSLDGLRAFAVTIVILFHAGYSWFPNGYIGVDIFFVLSGFLVTNVLLSEYEKTKTINLQAFLGKRMKRLLPAAITTIVFTTIFFWFFSSPVLNIEYFRNAQAALLYHANFYQIWEGNNYFTLTNESPFLHFWSLSIEEQFYFIFPIIFLVLLKTMKRKPLIAVIMLFLTGISLVYQLMLDDVSSYYSTFARIYQILAGVTLAVIKPSLPKNNISAVSLLSLFFLLVLTLPTEFNPQINGILATILTVSLLYDLKLPKVMETKLFVNIGKLSYGMYLWHWPIIVYMKQQNIVDTHILFWVSYSLSLSLAYVSFKTVEKKFGGKGVLI